MEKICKSISYLEGIQKDALFSLNKASDEYRDTLRVEDLYEGDSVVGADSDDDASRASIILFDEDGNPDNAMVPKPWQVYDSTTRPGVPYYLNRDTGESTWTHPALKS